MPKHELTSARFRELFGFDRVTPKGKPARHLTPAEMETMFGIRPNPPLTDEEKRRAKDIDLLFIDMYMYYNKSSVAVFEEAGRDKLIAPEALRVLHSHMLHHMSECPLFVVEYMRGELAPAVLHTKSRHFTKLA